MELNQNQTLGDGSKTLGQIMTPVQDPDYDSNSLKRSEFFFFNFQKRRSEIIITEGRPKEYLMQYTILNT